MNSPSSPKSTTPPPPSGSDSEPLGPLEDAGDYSQPPATTADQTPAVDASRGKGPFHQRESGINGECTVVDEAGNGSSESVSDKMHRRDGTIKPGKIHTICTVHIAMPSIILQLTYCSGVEGEFYRTTTIKQ